MRGPSATSPSAACECIPRPCGPHTSPKRACECIPRPCGPHASPAIARECIPRPCGPHVSPAPPASAFPDHAGLIRARSASECIPRPCGPHTSPSASQRSAFLQTMRASLRARKPPASAFPDPLRGPIRARRRQRVHSESTCGPHTSPKRPRVHSSRTMRASYEPRKASLWCIPRTMRASLQSPKKPPASAFPGHARPHTSPSCPAECISQTMRASYEPGSRQRVHSGTACGPHSRARTPPASAFRRGPSLHERTLRARMATSPSVVVYRVRCRSPNSTAEGVLVFTRGSSRPEGPPDPSPG